MKDEEVRVDLMVRTKTYALNIIRLCASLPSRPEAQVLGRQLLRSGTAVGAHYREAKRAKSDADFVSKVEGLLQELEESGYWLELLQESEIVQGEGVAALLDETHQLTAIFVKIVTKVKSRSK